MEQTIIITVIIASILDWKFRKIPNWLNFSVILLGLVFHSIAGGWDGFTFSLLGFAVGIALLYIPFALGGIGAGDVKYLAALGALIGAQLVFYVFLASTLFGAVFSLIAIIKHKALKTTLINIRNRFALMIAKRKVVSEDETQTSRNPIRIPYALSLGLGCLTIMIFQGGGLWTF